MTGLTETKQFSITAFTLVKITTNTHKHLAFVFNLNVYHLHSLPGQLTLQYIISEHAHFNKKGKLNSWQCVKSLKNPCVSTNLSVNVGLLKYIPHRAHTKLALMQTLLFFFFVAGHIHMPLS